MNMSQEHDGEHERREGLGGRVRRFVDTELSRVRDKENRGTETHIDHPGDPSPADREGVVDRSYDSRPVQETQRVHEPDQRSHSEPVDPNADEPGYVDRDIDGSGYADRPVATAPHDAGREPGLPSTPEELRGQSGDQLAADGGVARVGLLHDVAGLRDEWQRVQGTFVDDPQRAVHEASVLVDRTLDEIRANVGSKHPSETMSTEDLRVSFQRYREFFQRLLSA
jgi:hypothetical protein